MEASLSRDPHARLAELSIAAENTQITKRVDETEADFRARKATVMQTFGEFVRPGVRMNDPAQQALVWDILTQFVSDHRNTWNKSSDGAYLTRLFGVIKTCDQLDPERKAACIKGIGAVAAKVLSSSQPTSISSSATTGAEAATSLPRGAGVAAPIVQSHNPLSSTPSSNPAPAETTGPLIPTPALPSISTPSSAEEYQSDRTYEESETEALKRMLEFAPGFFEAEEIGLVSEKLGMTPEKAQQASLMALVQKAMTGDQDDIERLAKALDKNATLPNFNPLIREFFRGLSSSPLGAEYAQQLFVYELASSSAEALRFVKTGLRETLAAGGIDLAPSVEELIKNGNDPNLVVCSFLSNPSESTYSPIVVGRMLRDCLNLDRENLIKIGQLLNANWNVIDTQVFTEMPRVQQMLVECVRFGDRLPKSLLFIGIDRVTANLRQNQLSSFVSYNSRVIDIGNLIARLEPAKIEKFKSILSRCTCLEKIIINSQGTELLSILSTNSHIKSLSSLQIQGKQELTFSQLQLILSPPFELKHIVLGSISHQFLQHLTVLDSSPHLQNVDFQWDLFKSRILDRSGALITIDKEKFQPLEI